MSDDWFSVERIDDRTVVINEPTHVRSHLIVGDHRAVLFDSGLGVAPIRPVVESLTDLPVLVVNSHHHFDHVGGNHEFDEIAIHPEGESALAAGPPDGWLPSYWAGFLEYQQTLENSQSLQNSAAGGDPPPIASGSDARPLPASFDPRRPTFTVGRATTTIADGDVLSLGGRDLAAVHVPGHTRDSVCLIDESHGLLFGGDAVDVGTIYAHLPTSDLTDFVRSLRRLAGLLPPTVTQVLSPHGTTGRAPESIIRRLADALAHARDEPPELQDGIDCFLQPARIARIDGFSIYLPSDVEPVQRDSSPA